MALPPPKRTGTGFTNIQKYLQANRPGQLGQNISSRLQGEAQGIQTGLGKASDTFKSEVETNRLDTDINKQQRENVLGQVQQLKEPTEIQGKIQQKDVDAFSKFRAGEYKGPQEIKDSQTYLGQSKEIGELGKGLGTQQGRFNLLNRYLGGTGYSTGEKRFDNLLLGNAPQLGQARRQAIQSGKQVEGQIGGARSMAQDAIARNKAFAQETAGKLTGLESGITGDINTRLGQYLKDKPLEYAKWKKALETRDITEIPELQDLMNTQLFGVDPSQYLQQSADPTAANVAKMDERAKLQALNQLAGKPTTDLNFAPDVYDPTKAIGINREQMMKDIGEQQSRYNKTFTDLNQLEKYRGGAKKAIERHAEAYNLGPINNLNDLSKVMNTLNAHIHEQEKIKTGYDQPARTALQAEMAFIQDQINQVNNQLTSDYKLNDMFKTKKEVK